MAWLVTARQPGATDVVERINLAAEIWGDEVRATVYPGFRRRIGAKRCTGY